MQDTEHKDPTGRITQAELARRLKVTRGAVSKAVKSGRITPDEDGLFDPAEAELQWIANSRPNMKPSQSPAARARGTGYADARARKEHALARMAELRLEQALGTLYPLADLKFVMQDTAEALRGLLENLPDQLTPKLLALRDPNAIRLEIEAEMYRIQVSLAEHAERRIRELSEVGETVQPEG